MRWRPAQKLADPRQRYGASGSYGNLFSVQSVGTTGLAAAVATLTNNTSAPITVGTFTVSNSNDFGFVPINCFTPLAPGATCTWQMQFFPSAAGARSAAFSVQTSAGTPSIVFTGNGLAAGACPDADGDGLCDEWEQSGYIAHLSTGDIFVNLPAMGADPKHKDIFLHIDWMDTAKGIPGHHSHQPLPQAMRNDVTSFANAPVANPDGKTGINLHIDCGGCLGGLGGINGTDSIATALPEVVDLDPVQLSKTHQFDWTIFDQNSGIFLNSGRALSSHHLIFAHDQNPAYSSSGLSRNGSNFALGASDLVVTFGLWSSVVGTVNQQAGTLMHELGHNLALHHGGQDDVNYKANYLSIMNYLFQTTGIITNGAANLFDYSENALPTLLETNLNEITGLNYSATTYPAIGPLPAIDKVGTNFWCPGAFRDGIVSRRHCPAWHWHGECKRRRDVCDRGTGGWHAFRYCDLRGQRHLSSGGVCSKVRCHHRCPGLQRLGQSSFADANAWRKRDSYIHCDARKRLCGHGALYLRIAAYKRCVYLCADAARIYLCFVVRTNHYAYPCNCIARGVDGTGASGTRGVADRARGNAVRAWARGTSNAVAPPPPSRLRKTHPPGGRPQHCWGPSLSSPAALRLLCRP